MFDAATYGTSALLLTRMRLAGSPVRRASKGFVHQLREGWDAFTEHTWVWLVTAWISLYFMITYAPFFILGPYVSKNDFGGAGRGGHRHRRGSRRAHRGARRFARPSDTVDGRDLRVLRRDSDPVRPAGRACACRGDRGGGGVRRRGVLFRDSRVGASLQERIPRERLSRVSAYDWMGAMVFLPGGYAIAGPVATGDRRLGHALDRRGLDRDLVPRGRRCPGRAQFPRPARSRRGARRRLML